MFRLWPIVAVMTVGCGRIGFDDANPTFDLDLTLGDLGSAELTRPSPASYFDASGTLRFAAPHEPRFDHDPVTRTPRGLLLESGATNLLTYSEQMDAVVHWFDNGSVAIRADQATAPDGTLTADEFDDTDAGNISRRGHSIPLPDDELAYSYSVYARAGTSRTFTFAAELLGGAQQIQLGMTVDLVAGTIIQPPVVDIPFGIEPLPNGWHRVWMVLTNNGTGNDDGILSLWGNLENIANTGTVFAWGAQVEQSASPTSYIRTTSDSVTRAADVATVRDVSWLASDRGTLRVYAGIAEDRESASPAACLLAVTTPRLCVERSTAGTDARSAAWDLEGSSHANPSVGVLTGLPPPAAGTDRLGLGTDGSRQLDGHLERVTYWSRRFSDVELRELE
jgi:hypothetical protein